MDGGGMDRWRREGVIHRGNSKKVRGGSNQLFEI